MQKYDTAPSRNESMSAGAKPHQVPVPSTGTPAPKGECSYTKAGAAGTKGKAVQGFSSGGLINSKV